MKNLAIATLLLSTAALTPSTLAQTTKPQADESSASIGSARCAYTPSEAGCASVDDNISPTQRSEMVAQVPRRVGPPRGPRRPPASPRGIYRQPPMELNGRHVAIGALIGFGLGAALGAKGNTDQHPGVGVKAALLVGGVGALLGAAIGSGAHSFHALSRHRRTPWPDEEDEDAAQSAPRATIAVGQSPTPRFP